MPGCDPNTDVDRSFRRAVDVKSDPCFFAVGFLTSYRAFFFGHFQPSWSEAKCAPTWDTNR